MFAYAFEYITYYESTILREFFKAISMSMAHGFKGNIDIVKMTRNFTQIIYKCIDT